MYTLLRFSGTVGEFRLWLKQVAEEKGRLKNTLLYWKHVPPQDIYTKH